MYQKLCAHLGKARPLNQTLCSTSDASKVVPKKGADAVRHPLKKPVESETEFDTDESDTRTDINECEDQDRFKNLEYPKAVGFIISNEFCERFNYYGMRAILVLYLTHKLGYNEETSTVLFHIFTMLVYIFPLLGALIADGWLGKYKTILYLSVVYSLGALVVAIGAVPLEGMPVKIVTIVGLLCIAVGTGGIKPCVSAFGGDQFQLPEQSMQLAKFFSLFYFAINAGSMISTTVTPILRADVHCFGEDDCYSLAFGVPAILMVVSMLIFVAGKRRYRVQPPAGNMIFGVSQCITSAYKGWRENRKEKRMAHFLDYATPVVGQKMVHETKCLVKILLLYVPFPIFWALSDQQGSRWTFQATHMDGFVWGYEIKPDQMQVINPLLILAFIPLFDYVVYPLLARIGIRRPLQKLSIGLLLASFGFFISAALEMRLEQQSQSLNPNLTHLRLYNGMPCRYDFSSALSSTGEGGDLERLTAKHSIEPLSMWNALGLHVPQPTELKFVFTAQSAELSSKCPRIEGQVRLEPGKSVSYFLAKDALNEFAEDVSNDQHTSRSPLIRTLLNTPMDEGPVLLSRSIPLDTSNLSTLHQVALGHGELDINGQRAASFEAKSGRLYNLLVQGNAEDGYQHNLLEVMPTEGGAPTLSILWQLPQIIVMTAAEIMFSVTGLEFSFTQAPVSMKAVLQACWLLSVAIGNMIVVVIAEVKFVESQSAEFALFAILMLVNLLLFLFLARNYKYTDCSQQQENETDVNEQEYKHIPKIGRTAKGGVHHGIDGQGSYRNAAFDASPEP
ncbi:peptide transporter family 1 isoform X1 [Drosophila albomicans]|uniref:Oligopeptide transporter 1 n=1 Tax=Drosophila albomicans TaxID=7291 RepID=A0A6P8XPW2_DROAB|nr:peptide transporter family 1 isoform X1 [Drosophila albomicans]